MIRPEHYHSKEAREQRKERDKRALVDTTRMAEQACLNDPDSVEKDASLQKLYAKYRETYGHEFPKPKLHIKK